jgi:monoterpene epsilon-lactone hydrolase
VTAVIRAAGEEGHQPADIAVYGESAGGALAAAAVLKLRDADPLLNYPDNLKRCADAYAKPSEQKHPHVSPVYADYTKGFPPTLIQVGTREILLSNSVRHYRAMEQAGVDVVLDVYEGMWHVFQVLTHDIPEADMARRKVRAFLDRHLGR